MADDSAKGDMVAAKPPAQAVSYRVLARKYRPLSFDALIGQEAMVRTLTNAMDRGRLAHAFILTGVRGIGKTTTARIIARALNCTGPDGRNDQPTITPCGQCDHCRAIMEDRHVDVIEMDAASRTGVDDIREIIDGVQYRPVSARYKVYIVDEVHMLSRNAFNALLKTLEEPPEHVVFIFATTEIRKVPVTVLSRCQRFDLRRVAPDALAEYLADIAKKEGTSVEADALALLARAADGSVRDGLSLLDQAIAHAGAAPVAADQLRDMLGLADRAQVLDLFDRLMRGTIREAIELFDVMYRAGADPVVVLQDLLEVCHWITRLKIVEDAAESEAVSEGERARGRELALGLAMPALTRAWQILLKGLAEAQRAPQPRTAAEMVLIRLAYAAELPSPADVVRQLEEGGDGAASAIPAGAQAAHGVGSGALKGRMATVGEAGQATARQPAPEAPPDAVPGGTTALAPEPASFEEVVALFEDRREGIMAAQLRGSVHLVHFEPGLIEIRPGAGATDGLAGRLGERLSSWTGRRWVVSVSGEAGEPTLTEQAQARMSELRRETEAHPLVRAALDLFPDARIVDIRPLVPTGDQVAPAEEPDSGDLPLTGPSDADDEEQE